MQDSTIELIEDNDELAEVEEPEYGDFEGEEIYFVSKGTGERTTPRELVDALKGQHVLFRLTSPEGDEENRLIEGVHYSTGAVVIHEPSLIDEDISDHFQLSDSIDEMEEHYRGFTIEIIK